MYFLRKDDGKTGNMALKTPIVRFQYRIPQRTQKRSRGRHATTKTKGDQRENPVNVDLPVFAIEQSSFHLEGDTFTIDDDLDPTPQEEAKLGLNGEEGELDQEPKPFEQIPKKEFLHHQAKDRNCQQYARTIGLTKPPFDFDQSRI